jgi:hypothetical protein
VAIFLLTSIFIRRISCQRTKTKDSSATILVATLVVLPGKRTDNPAIFVGLTVQLAVLRVMVSVAPHAMATAVHLAKVVDRLIDLVVMVTTEALVSNVLVAPVKAVMVANVRFGSSA